MNNQACNRHVHVCVLRTAGYVSSMQVVKHVFRRRRIFARFIMITINQQSKINCLSRSAQRVAVDRSVRLSVRLFVRLFDTAAAGFSSCNVVSSCVIVRLRYRYIVV